MRWICIISLIFTFCFSLFASSTPPGSIDMVYVEGSSFTMGDTAGGGSSDEKPTHQVTLSSFYIGKYEVTQKQWQEVMGNNPSYFKGDDLPVEQVSWYDCVDFCNKLSQKEDLTPCYSGSGAKITCNWNANGYRLPTEAEWEYAAKGGNKSKGLRFSGSKKLRSVAWYYGNSSKTNQVGQKQANELGIYDMTAMSGNGAGTGMIKAITVRALHPTRRVQMRARTESCGAVRGTASASTAVFPAAPTISLPTAGTSSLGSVCLGLNDWVLSFCSLGFLQAFSFL